MRVVLDTNVIVSGIVYPYGASGRIVSTWKGGALDVVLSRYIIDEFRRVLPKLSRGATFAVALLAAVRLVALPAPCAAPP